LEACYNPERVSTVISQETYDVEIEAKFAVPDRETFERLQAIKHLSSYTLSNRQIKIVQDAYLDTPKRELLAAGYACRRRTQSEGVLITLKGLGGVEGAIHRREEYEIHLSTNQPPEAWPSGPVRDRVLEVINQAPLNVLFSLSQTRLVHQMKQGERIVAQLSLDDVHLIIDEAEQTYFELEIEQTSSGTEEDLAKLAAYLQNEWHLQPESLSKFERALAFVDAAMTREVEPQAGASVANPGNVARISETHSNQVELSDKPGLTLDDSMAEAARKTLWFHLQRLIYYESGTRQGNDIEALHNMRVATRRMRAAYQISADYLDAEQMAPFLKGIRRTARVLGAVRDLDVFWEKTEDYLVTLPVHEQTALESLREVWTGQHKIAREEMLNYLNSKRYRRFKEKFARFLQQPNAGTLPTTTKKGFPLPNRPREIIPIAIYQRLAEVQAYDPFVTASNMPAEYLHQLRIACKGLRYTLEFFQDVLGPEAKKLIQQLKKLQTHLGDLQDAVVASKLLRAYLFWGTWNPQQYDKNQLPGTSMMMDPGVTMYLASRETEYQTLVETFPEAWDRFQNSPFKEVLAKIVAKL
jgi:CHAD domain-containing protein/adenylate cyclase class IV